MTIIILCFPCVRLHGFHFLFAIINNYVIYVMSVDVLQVVVQKLHATPFVSWFHPMGWEHG